MDPEIAKSLKEAANIGKSKFTEFVVSRIEKAYRLSRFVSNQQEEADTRMMLLQLIIIIQRRTSGR